MNTKTVPIEITMNQEIPSIPSPLTASNGSSGGNRNKNNNNQSNEVPDHEMNQNEEEGFHFKDYNF